MHYHEDLVVLVYIFEPNFPWSKLDGNYHCPLYREFPDFSSKLPKLLIIVDFLVKLCINARFCVVACIIRISQTQNYIFDVLIF